jgi:hypothetical protein
MRFQQFTGKNSSELTLCSTIVVGAYGQEDNIFNICCSSSEFLLEYLKVITVMHPIATFINCYSSQARGI